MVLQMIKMALAGMRAALSSDGTHQRWVLKNGAWQRRDQPSRLYIMGLEVRRI